MAETTYTFFTSPAMPGVGFIERGGDHPALIPLDLLNMDYQAFLAWVAEGNPAPSGWTGPTNTS